MQQNQISQLLCPEVLVALLFSLTIIYLKLQKMSKRSSGSGTSPTTKSQRLTKSSTLPLGSQPSSLSSQDEKLDVSFGFLEDSSGGYSSKPPEKDDSNASTTSQFERLTQSSEQKFSPIKDSQESLAAKSFSSMSMSSAQFASSPFPNQCSPRESHHNFGSNLSETFFSETDTDLDHENLACLAEMVSGDADSFLPDTVQFETQPGFNFEDFLANHIRSRGIADTASSILSNEDLKTEILKILMKDSHESLKKSLKKSQLCADKTDRKYLLSLTPKSLCEEFQRNSTHSFQLLVQGLLGISDPKVIFDSQFLMNNLVFIYSSIAKVLNRKATGYALLMTTAVRDGGLREDSVKLFSMLVHPRTSQKYDRNILAKDWDQSLLESLNTEKEHFKKLHMALLSKSEAVEESAPDHILDEINEEVSKLVSTVPKQVQKVWDNLNLRTKHRFERGKDEYSTNNLDWMASLWIKDRVNVNHMDCGEPAKDAKDLKIEDYVPNEVEKDYIFQSLVCYFSSRLVERYPESFKSIKACIKPNKPHQFQDEMDSKSEEFTGELFTKSETKTEDLIEMMIDIQKKYVHTFENKDGTFKCFEKKILSGDNKTEKNQTYGIIRLKCEYL